jgi:peroxiredoxin
MFSTDASVYNRDTFHTDMVGDLRFHAGPRPGETAPDFDLPTTEGAGRFRLSARRGRHPVLITFGSLTCPFTLASLAALHELHPIFKNRIELVSI